jgi:hypothetical protein
MQNSNKSREFRNKDDDYQPDRSKADDTVQIHNCTCWSTKSSKIIMLDFQILLFSIRMVPFVIGYMRFSFLDLSLVVISLVGECQYRGSQVP